MENKEIVLRPVARIRTDFAAKFGVPRQAGLVPELRGKIVFEPEYRSADAVRGLEEFSHIWLIWYFSAAVREGESFSPTVRPPRLGGNARVGVFASRSPFRPNHIAISSLPLERIDYDDPEGPVLWVRGADLMDGTPILDVKPYLPYADAHPEASAGFTALRARSVRAHVPAELLDAIDEEKRPALLGVLEQDPRPSYQDDPDRIYGFGFAGREIRFRVEGQDLVVVDII